MLLGKKIRNISGTEASLSDGMIDCKLARVSVQPGSEILSLETGNFAKVVNQE